MSEPDARGESPEPPSPLGVAAPPAPAEATAAPLEAPPPADAPPPSVAAPPPAPAPPAAPAPAPASPAAPAPSAAPAPAPATTQRLSPDHVAAMHRADDLERKLGESRRMLGSLQGELLRVSTELERTREQARALPTPRPTTRAALLGAGAAFGLLASVLLQLLLFPGASPEAASSPGGALDVPVTPGLPPGRGPSAPRIPGSVPAWRGRVTSSTAARVPPGQTCVLAVDVQAGQGARGVMCQALLECGATTLYGGTQSGYFPCTLQGLDATGHPRITGSDDDVSAGDGDPAFVVDTDARRVRVWETSSGDGPFDVTITLDPA